jgi:NAD+ diphosphatase
VPWPYALPTVPALSRGTLDRAAERRTDEAWLAAAWHHPATRVLVVGERGSVAPPTGDRLALVPPGEAPDGERYLLGTAADGAAVFAVRAAGPDEPPAGAVTARDVGASLRGDDAGLLVHAVALANWHARHPHCPRCGALTEVTAAGASRTCVRDETEHYPRTDPAMIVLVVDGADRALLGAHRRTGPGRWTTLAGFVEAGESVEQAVRREVVEEAGVVVADVAYAGSQPWPFPASLMLGCYGRAAAGDDLRPDGDEVLDVRWFDRDELGAATAAGTVRLPSRTSIARLLIEGWYGAELPGSW